jgi:predicted alpha/beta hydrolase family esterase
MKPRIIYVHGNGGSNWAFAWAPWLKKQLDVRRYETVFRTMPDSVLARSSYWLPFLHDEQMVGENDVLVGWSSGAVAAMRYAEKYTIRGSVLVAPSYTDLGNESERASGYFDTPWDWTRIKAHQQHIVLVHSDNDSLIPLSESEYINRQLTPERIVVPGGGHFIEYNQFPEVLNAILRFGESTKSL